MRALALALWADICNREEWQPDDMGRRTAVWRQLLGESDFDSRLVTPRQWDDLAAKLEEFLADPFAGTPGATPQLEEKPKRKDPAGAVPAAFR